MKILYIVVDLWSEAGWALFCHCQWFSEAHQPLVQTLMSDSKKDLLGGLGINIRQMRAVMSST